jgi:hypothetical protein
MSWPGSVLPPRVLPEVGAGMCHNVSCLLCVSVLQCCQPDAMSHSWGSLAMQLWHSAWGAVTEKPVPVAPSVEL